MDRIALEVVQRNARGKKDVKQLRRKGFVPAVVYGNLGNDVFSVDSVIFENILKQHRTFGSIVFSLEFDGSSKDRLAIVREVQRHPLTGQMLNIDFKEISMKEKIVSKVSLIATGNAPGVQMGGILEQHMWEISVCCLPGQIPDEYKVDISELNVGDFVYVADIPRNENIEIIDDDKELILAIVSPRKATPEEEADVPGEGGVAEPEVTKQKSVTEKESS